MAANAVTANNEGAFSMDFWAECANGASSPPSSTFDVDQSKTIDLTHCGFEEGAQCWVSCNIVAGEQGHKSGENFVYSANGGTAVYKIDGTTFTPSWHLESGG